MKTFIGSKDTPEDREIKEKICVFLKSLGERIIKEPTQSDLAIVIGGDGTFLFYQGKFTCPILGIKTRGIGYYMSTSKKDYLEKIGKVCQGTENKDYFVRKFLRLKAHLNKKPLPLALNEYLISAGLTRKMFNAKLKAKARESFERNSGIIIYTPTGSSGFASSCGAKKMKEIEDKFGVIALAPYSGRLKEGEIILNKGKVIIECLDEEGEVCVDGKEKYTYKIKYGDKITIEKSDNYIRVIRFGNIFNF